MYETNVCKSIDYESDVEERRRVACMSAHEIQCHLGS